MSHYVEIGKAVVTQAGIKADGECVDNCGIGKESLEKLHARGILTSKDPLAKSKAASKASDKD